MTYTFTDHIHNFAVWTAARAVQRNFSNTKTTKEAIELTKLKDLIDSQEYFTEKQYDDFHRETSHTIIDHLKSISPELGMKTTYGRAAKIIAIYIKTTVVIRNCGLGNLSKVAHPPIDSILMKNLHTQYKNFGFNEINWTQLSEIQYFDLIQKLRKFNYEFFWQIEEFWSPVL